MAFLAKVHLSCFLLSYLAAFGGELVQLLRKQTGLTRGIIATSAAAGLLAHTAYLVNRSLSSGLPPLVGSSHDWLLVLAWLGAVIYTLTVCFQTRNAISLFILPILLGLVLLAVFVEDSTEAVDKAAASYRWGMLHAFTLVLGMATVAAATLCAVMYLLQYQKLRGGKSRLHRLQLPSLERLTSVNRILVITTVLMLTVGLVTGVILGVGASGSSSSFRWSDPIVLATTVIWVMLVSYLAWLLPQKEQTGRQVARLTLVAGGFLLLTIFGLMLLTGGVHGNTEAKASQTAALNENDSAPSLPGTSFAVTSFAVTSFPSTGAIKA